jgi:hypothetical protein
MENNNIKIFSLSSGYKFSQFHLPHSELHINLKRMNYNLVVFFKALASRLHRTTCVVYLEVQSFRKYFVVTELTKEERRKLNRIKFHISF